MGTSSGRTTSVIQRVCLDTFPTLLLVPASLALMIVTNVIATVAVFHAMPPLTLENSAQTPQDVFHCLDTSTVKQQSVRSVLKRAKLACLRPIVEFVFSVFTFVKMTCVMTLVLLATMQICCFVFAEPARMIAILANQMEIASSATVLLTSEN